MYASEIREWFYKKNFRSIHKNVVIDEAAKGCPPGWYWCAGFGNYPRHRVRRDQITIDHSVLPVASHWNSIGHLTDQKSRYEWYDDPRNLAALCRRCNSAKGSKVNGQKVPYNPKVGPAFKGWRE